MPMAVDETVWESGELENAALIATLGPGSASSGSDKQLASASTRE